MFIGHYGPAIYDVLRSNKIKLWQAFLAVQAMDIVFAILALFGVEGGATVRDGALVFNIPWSHSFVSALVIAFLAAAIYRLIYRGNKGSARGFWIIAGLAFSHWVLDLLVHRPDLPWYPGGTSFLGFSLWDYAWLSFGLEVILLGAAVAWWLAKSSGPLWTSIVAWVFVAAVSVLHFGSITRATLDLQAGTLDLAAMPDGIMLSVTMFIFFFGAAGIIGWLESKRAYN